MVKYTWSSACPGRGRWHRPLSLDVTSHMHQLQRSRRRISSNCKAFGWISEVGADLEEIKTAQLNTELPNIPEIPIVMAKARATRLATFSLPCVYLIHEGDQICVSADSGATILSLASYRQGSPTQITKQSPDFVVNTICLCSRFPIRERVALCKFLPGGDTFCRKALNHFIN